MLSCKNQPNPTLIHPSPLPDCPTRRKKLFARWMQVNGRLVCQWLVEDMV